MRELLKQAGLNGYESQVYLTLLHYGEIKAKNISELSSVPLTAVYPNLKSLNEKGLVQKLAGEISIYQALPPEQALSSYIEARKKCLNELKEELVAKAEKFHSKLIEKKEAVRLSYGKEISTLIYLELLARTKRTYYVLGWTFKTIGNKYTHLQKFKDKVKREHIDVRVILAEKPKQKNLVRAYLMAGVKIRYYPLKDFTILLADEKESKITLRGEDLAHRYNIHILDQNLSKALQSYFLQLWEKASEVKFK